MITATWRGTNEVCHINPGAPSHETNSQRLNRPHAVRPPLMVPNPNPNVGNPAAFHMPTPPATEADFELPLLTIYCFEEFHRTDRTSQRKDPKGNRSINCSSRPFSRSCPCRSEGTQRIRSDIVPDVCHVARPPPRVSLRARGRSLVSRIGRCCGGRCPDPRGNVPCGPTPSL